MRATVYLTTPFIEVDNVCGCVSVIAVSGDFCVTGEEWVTVYGHISLEHDSGASIEASASIVRVQRNNVACVLESS